MKKLTVLLIALILAAMCASCAKPAETPAENPAEPAPAAQEPEPAPEPETPAQQTEAAVAEAEVCFAAGETALANVRGYMEQIRKDVAAVEGAGGSASWLGENIQEAERALADAEEAWVSLSEHYGKMMNALSKTDGTDEEKLIRVALYKNKIYVDLKKMTKVGEFEASSARSAETRIRLISEKIREEIAAAYPELDLGGAFTPEPVDLSGLSLSE